MAGALASAIVVLGSSAGAEPMADAVHSALRSHPSVLAAQQIGRAAEQGVTVAGAGFLPSVDVRIGNGFARTNSSTTRGRTGRAEDDQQSIFLYRFESSVTLSQMLFDGFSTRSRVGAAQARQQGASFQVMGIEEGVALRAVTAYLGVMQGRALFALGEDYIKAHEDVLEGLKTQMEGGAGTQADVDQATGRLAQAKASVLQFRGTLTDAEAAYREAIGTRPGELVLPVPQDAVLPQNADAAVDESVATHPGLKALAENARALSFDAAAAAAPFKPRVSLDLMGTRNENAGGTKGPTADATAMVNLTYNLYRGGADQAALESARALLNEARLRQEESRRLIEQGVRVAFNAHDISAARLPQLEDAANAAAEGRKSFDDKFEAGDVQLIDRLTIEDQLFQARGALVTARFAVLLSHYQVLGAMGRLHTSL